MTQPMSLPCIFMTGLAVGLLVVALAPVKEGEVEDAFRDQVSRDHGVEPDRYLLQCEPDRRRKWSCRTDVKGNPVDYECEQDMIGVSCHLEGSHAPRFDE